MIALLIVTLFAAPPFPVPKLATVMQASLTDKARIRWSKSVEGRIVSITFSGGIAERIDTGIQPGPSRLKYDLTRNRELEGAVRAAHLSAQMRPMAAAEKERTLEIIAEGPKEWMVVGRWTMTVAAWKKKAPELVDHVEPLFAVVPDLFQPQREPPK
jgi:hypothetical protein